MAQGKLPSLTLESRFNVISNNGLGQRNFPMMGLKGEERGVVADLKVEQYPNNRADCLDSYTSEDILVLDLT